MHRRSIAVAVALGIFLLLLFWTHAYFADRLVRATALPQPWRAIASGVILALGISIIANPLVERTFGPRAGRVLGWPAYIWMGCCFYLLIALWTSDLLLLLTGLRGVHVQRVRALAVCGLTLAVVGSGMRAALKAPAHKLVDVALPGWPLALDGYRIVQISDIHVGSLLRRPFIEHLVQRCNALQPDLLAITGDLVDGSVTHLGGEIAPLAELRARDGVYFVTGNHDHFSGAERWVQRVRELGIEVLRNRRVPIEHDGARFELAGVDDLSSRRLEAGPHGFDLDAALAGWDGQTPLVLLSHDPRAFEMARKRGIGLQLSGHTHDGQLWPFRFMVRLQTRFLAGLYRSGSSALYVSRGTGFWGPPVRVGAPSEITELRLRCAGS